MSLSAVEVVPTSCPVELSSGPSCSPSVGDSASSFFASQVMYSEVSATHSSPFMNFTDVSSLLANTSGIQGVVPRWIFLAQLSSPTDRTRNTSVVLLALDSALEATAQLGSSWNLPPLGQSDAYVVRTVVVCLLQCLLMTSLAPSQSQSALDEIGVTAGTGDSATIQLSLSNALNLLSTSTSSGKFNIPSTLTAATVSTALGSLGIHLSTVTINPSPALRAFLNLIGLNSEGAPITAVSLHYW